MRRQRFVGPTESTKGWRRWLPVLTWAGKLRPTSELLRDAGREVRWYGVSIGQCGFGFLIAWKLEGG